ncbi:hypothetical protein [Propionivibrio dicarboxylicus]|uniref:Uncharacterized protein n=1 Tax=Propionivibrio dicarboxylicus TaxID=83767 RepID=A0A1G7WJL2_9RHOO|nr:hypothetical protein [Propionivibrio dicarboxylicus]SDG72132.1 hypothetical protein SAMN05660652_00541 [Propionivibrio dicarboxylicus]
MANANNTSTQKSPANQITKSDIESARIYLSGCEALSAIANAVEILSSLDPKPEKLFSHTITRLMTHAVYLADSVDNDVGCFIEEVEKSIM